MIAVNSIPTWIINSLHGSWRDFLWHKSKQCPILCASNMCKGQIHATTTYNPQQIAPNHSNVWAVASNGNSTSCLYAYWQFCLSFPSQAGLFTWVLEVSDSIRGTFCVYTWKMASCIVVLLAPYGKFARQTLRRVWLNGFPRSFPRLPSSLPADQHWLLPLKPIFFLFSFRLSNQTAAAQNSRETSVDALFLLKNATGKRIFIIPSPLRYIASILLRTGRNIPYK